MSIPVNVMRHLNEQDDCHLFTSGDCIGIDGHRCDSVLEIDHSFPRSKGGDDSVRNCKKICKGHNRMKSDKIDSRFTNLTFWDQLNEDLLQKVLTRLRQSQKKMLSNLLSIEGQKFIVDNYDKLLNHINLLVAQPGLGKSMMAVLAVLLINKILRDNNPATYRPNKRVLFLVPEIAIAEQLANEYTGYRSNGKKVPSELVSILGLHFTPKVLLVKSTAELTPNIVKRYDVIICCQQSLWTTQDEVKGLSEIETKILLDTIDVLIVDECHFAPKQLRNISQVARNCLKIFLTATPFDKDMNFFSEINGGEHKELFKLLGVAQADDSDNSHKKLNPLFKQEYEEIAIKAINSGQIIPCQDLNTYLSPSYYCVNGGDALLQKGNDQLDDYDTDCRANKPRLLRLIEKAKSMCSDNGHILVVTDRISKVMSINKILNEYADEIGESNWQSTYSIGGSLSHTSPKHPFNFAKENKGILTPDCSRILIVDDLGKIGFNNCLIEVIVYVDVENSIIAIIQRYGRGERWKESINMAMNGNGINKKNIKIIWDNASDSEQKFLKNLWKSINYSLNLEEVIKEKFDSIITINKDYQLQVIKETDLSPLPKNKQNVLVEKALNLLNQKVESSELITRTLEGEGLTNGKLAWTEKWLGEQVFPSLSIGLSNESTDKIESNYMVTEEYQNQDFSFADYSYPEVPQSSSDETGLVDENNKRWDIPYVVEPVTYCFHEYIPDPTKNELIDFIDTLPVDSVTKDILKQRINMNESTTLEFYTQQYKQRNKVIESNNICGYDPKDILGTTLRKKAPKELQKNNFYYYLWKELIDAYRVTSQDQSRFRKDLSSCLYTAVNVVFGLSSFSDKDPTFKEKKNEIAYAMIADPRKENVQNKIITIARALIIHRSYWNYRALSGLYFKSKQQIDWISFYVEKRFMELKNANH